MRNLLLSFTLSLFFSFDSAAQNTFSFNCTKDTTINCIQQCLVLKAKIPDIRSATNSYSVNSITATGGCFRAYVSPSQAGPSAGLIIDDKYSAPLNITFPFLFYGTVYNQLVASTNGYLSFDVSVAGTFSHFGMLNTNGVLGTTTGIPQNLPSVLYDKGLIMGPYHDLDPAYTTSPTQQIKYEVTGTAPYRKWILSFYKVPLYYTPGGCDQLFQNTHQIVLYESLGIVEIFVYDKQICTGWNEGRAMIGMQNFSRDAAIMAPGRKASDNPWGTIGMNESWRFAPSSGPSLFKHVELYDLAGNLISFGDTSAGGNNTLLASFQNVCPSFNGTTTYVVRSTYSSITNAAVDIIGTDTIRVLRGSNIVATTTTTTANCSNNNIGSITVNVTTGTGPFEYSIDNGLTWQSSNTFNKPSGTYTILVRTVGTTCSASFSASVVAGSGNLSATYIITPVKCNGGADGTIIINVTLGASPYQYSINGGITYQANNSFTLASGIYNVRIKDALNCTKDTVINITQPASLVLSATTTNATCSAIPDGNITATAGGGVGNFSYSLNAATFQTANQFLLTPGTYTVTVKDGNGCTKNVSAIVGLTNTLTLTGRNDTAICFGDSVILITNSNATTFSWAPAVNLNSSGIASPVAKPASSTTYFLTVQSGTCIKKDTVVITVNPAPVVNAGPDVTILSGDITILQGSSSSSNYLWSPATGLNATNIPNPTAKPATTTLYSLTSINNIGCKGTDDVLVTVLPYCLKPKGAFTPNGDGVYDTWVVTDGTSCVSNVEVNVFNRYGNKVFESKNYNNDWKGTYKGELLPVGTYYYVIKYTLINGNTVDMKGNVTILR